MKIKIAAAAVLMVLGSSVSAYQFELNLGHSITDIDGVDDDLTTTSVGGEYHFSDVNTGSHPLAEAAFLEKSSNAYIARDRIEVGQGEADLTTVGAEFYIPNTIFYAAAEVVRTESGNSSESDFGVRLGVTPVDGLLITTSYYDDAGYDLNLDAKYVSQLSSGNFFNLEASYVDLDNGDSVSAFGDYYIDTTFSVGGGIIDIDGEDAISLRTRKFFTDNFSGELEYVSTDNSDTVFFGGAWRF